MTETIEGVVEQQFEVGEGAELSVSNVAGRITVRTGSPGVIAMVATKRGRESAMEQTRIETSQDGDRVTIQTRQESSGLFGLVRGMCAVEYDLVVPPGCPVRAKSVSANVFVSGTGSSLHLDTVSGDAEIEDITGACEISTVSGDVRGRRVEGTLTVRTTSGNVELADSELATFNFHGVSGDLHVQSPLAGGAHYYAKTVSGDVVLTVPADTGASIQMRTVSGRVESVLPAQIVKSGPRHWQGVINGGGATVELQSVSGDLRVLNGGGEPRMTAENHDAEVAQVLTALEQGETTVEDAMARINALRGRR